MPCLYIIMPLKLSPTQIAFNARGDGRFNKPFQAQVAFFKQKLNLPTERYDDILGAAHDRAFVVAGAQKADLLDDLRQIVDKSIAEGKSIGWFRKNFAEIVKQRGWEGWTGSDTKAGRDWRTRVIYRTNIASSYAAGRWQQLNDPRLLKTMPYWKYIHNDTVSHPRPLHVSWSGLVLKHDDPFWQSHFPPNGWGCRCRVTAVSGKAYKGEKAPDNGVYSREDKTGNKHTIPKGIDFGWDYAPGASTDTSLRNMVQNKLVNYPKAIARALSRDINKQVSASRDIVDYADRALNDPVKEMFFLGFVESFELIDKVLNSKQSVQGFIVLLDSNAVRHANKSHQFDGKAQRAIVPEDYDNLADALGFPDEVKTAKTSKISGYNRFEVRKTVDGEQFRLIFEVFPGAKKNIKLVSFVIKTKK